MSNYKDFNYHSIQNTCSTKQPLVFSIGIKEVYHVRNHFLSVEVNVTTKAEHILTHCAQLRVS